MKRYSLATRGALDPQAGGWALGNQPFSNLCNCGASDSLAVGRKPRIPFNSLEKKKKARNGVKWRTEKFLFKTHKSGVHSASNTLNGPPAKHVFEFLLFYFVFGGQALL